MQLTFKDNTMQVIDPQLLSFISKDDPTKVPDPQLYCVDAILGLGLSCAADTPVARIGIREAVCQLKAVRDSLLKNTEIKEC